MKPRTAAVIGAPGQFGQPLAGTDKGPQLLREAGLHQSLADLGWRVEEIGDVVREREVHHTNNRRTYPRWSAFVFNFISYLRVGRQ